MSQMTSLQSGGKIYKNLTIDLRNGFDQVTGTNKDNLVYCVLYDRYLKQNR